MYSFWLGYAIHFGSGMRSIFAHTSLHLLVDINNWLLCWTWRCFLLLLRPAKNRFGPWPVTQVTYCLAPSLKWPASIHQRAGGMTARLQRMKKRSRTWHIHYSSGGLLRNGLLNDEWSLVRAGNITAGLSDLLCFWQVKGGGSTFCVPEGSVQIGRFHTWIINFA